MRGAWRALFALVLAGCTSDAGPETGEGGFRVVVRYDSTMSVAAFAIAALGPDGAEVWPVGQHDAPLFLDPPGTREAIVSMARPDVEQLQVLVDGLSEAGAVVGSGQATIVLTDPTLEEVVVSLGAPVTCGDGRRSGREACDDGNDVSEDGCSALCVIEPGWSCEGLPSRCGRCGDGELGPGELCDDGNLTDGDGCSAACQLEEAQQPYLLEAEALAPQQTESPEWSPVEGARLELPTAEGGDRWVVFASGTLGSSSDLEISAKAALRIDGEVVDDFGHQTLGAEDNAAGFVTFHVVERQGPLSVDVAFASASEDGGVTTIAQVRLVAMRTPQRALLQDIASLDPQEVRGIDVSLATMDLGVEAPGRYLVLAKANSTEAPGSDTSRVWLETPEGRVPFDERGVSFSSPRDARVPFFVARPMRLEPGDTRFELKGTTSGSGSVDAWWSSAYPYRRQVTVTAAEAALPPGYSVPITFDHATLVDMDMARADGGDVRVVYGDGPNGREIPRVPDPNQGWGRSDTRLWVQLPDAVEAAATLANVWLYFGAAQPAPPLEDPDDVFVLYDGFDGRTLDPRWQAGNGAPQLGGGVLVVPSDSSIATPLDIAAIGSGLMVEARLKFEDAPEGESLYLGTGTGRDGTFGGAGFGTRQGQHVYGAGGMFTPYMPDSPLQFHRYQVASADGLTAVFFQDDVEVGRLPSIVPNADLTGIGMQNGTRTTIQYDWVRVRRWVEPAPSISVEPTTGVAGVRPSTFDGLRILAMRVDAFDGFFSETADAPVRTTESATVSLVRVEVPEPDRAREHLVVLGTRVAGESSERRREGICIADGQALLRTSHRINRGMADATGYHHIAGVIDARTTAEAAVYETAIRSPDGLEVEGAASTAAVLRF